MILTSPDDFEAAVRSYGFAPFAFDEDDLASARVSLAQANLLLVGEPHGVYETPGVLYSLSLDLDIRAVAFEWSWEEMDGVLQDFVGGGPLDFEQLWSLPPSAEFFCGDGRITPGHFALLQRLRDEDRLGQVITFDRLDPEQPVEAVVRERDMARRLLAEWDERLPLLVLTGAFHARLDAEAGETMATNLARERPGLQAGMLDYAGGQCRAGNELHDLSGPMPPSPITLRLPKATPASVPEAR
ncbi:MAG: hypothetical protein H0V79_06875 [Actinobacteria bacterium]|nr:hypothetical protein [Actinomycetota bacterium]